jgi:hypothetical protein
VIFFSLPSDIARLVAARNLVRDHYAERLKANGSAVQLSFTLDGNLIGDLGEALAMDLFGIQLVETKSTEAIDGYAPDGRSVQIKATGTGHGPAFRQTETRADHLIFLDLDLDRAIGESSTTGQSITRFGSCHQSLQVSARLPEDRSAQQIGL